MASIEGYYTHVYIHKIYIDYLIVLIMETTLDLVTMFLIILLFSSTNLIELYFKNIRRGEIANSTVYTDCCVMSFLSISKIMIRYML